MEENRKAYDAALAGLLHGMDKVVDLTGLHVPISARDWMSTIVAANRLASGGTDINPPHRLLSIFSKILEHDKKGYIPFLPLDVEREKSLFPEALSPEEYEKPDDGAYKKLWTDFEQACASAGLANINDTAVYLEKILPIMQKYTWCMPSSAGEDISWFNNSRVRAAVSSCLAMDEFSDELPESLETSTKQVCLLVWGDISRLQDFIYSLASEGAAKCLRARSFYVQLLGEVLAYRVLHELDLPVTNLIYVGGGGFQLLVPLKVEKKLADTVRDLTERLLVVHGGELGLTVEWEMVTVGDFTNFGRIYARLGKRLNRAKRKPFYRASSGQLFKHLNQPLTLGGNPLRYCIVTGEDGDNLVKFEKDSTRWKSEFVASLEKLGNDLPKVSYFILKRVEPKSASRAITWREALMTFGMDVHLVRKDEEAPNVAPLKGEFLRVWRLHPDPSNQEASLLLHLDSNRVISYRPFAQLTPTVDENARKRPKTFDEFAENPVQENCNFKRWGVLRMDVDNLGNLFGKGFGTGVSLVRIASLSFALRLFFEGYLPELARAQKGDGINNDLSDHLYIQYSGGDDVFVVGSWDALPEFAFRIRKAFSRYVADNPQISISGGVGLFAEKYPLYLAAKETGASEHKAKSLDGKNGLCFLDEAFHWDEFESARDLAYKLAEFIRRNQVPRSLIQTMLMFYEQRKESIRNTKINKPVYGRWTWLAAYQFSRALKSLDVRKPELKDARQILLNLQDKFASPSADLRNEALAARWTQFLTR